MIKNLKHFFISVILLYSFIASIGIGVSLDPIENEADLLQGSWIKTIDGVTIVYVTGTHYQMGYQYGHYLKDEIYMNCRAFFYRCPKDLFSFSDVLFEWFQITNLSMVPQIYQDEIQGLLDGANIDDFQPRYQESIDQSITMY